MIVRVSGLRVRGFHGVLESERRDGQSFVVNVFLADPVIPPIDVVLNWTSMLAK